METITILSSKDIEFKSITENRLTVDFGEMKSLYKDLSLHDWL